MKIIFSLTFLFLLISSSSCSSRVESSKDHQMFLYKLSKSRSYPVVQPAARIENLELALSDLNPIVRKNALLDLGSLAKTENKAVDALVRALDSARTDVRLDAACSLGKVVGVPSDKLLEVLIEAARSGNSSQQSAAMRALSVYAADDPGIAAVYGELALQYNGISDDAGWQEEYRQFQKKQLSKRSSTVAGEETEPDKAARIVRQQQEAAEVQAKVEQDIVKQYGSIEAYQKARSEQTK